MPLLLLFSDSRSGPHGSAETVWPFFILTIPSNADIWVHMKRHLVMGIDPGATGAVAYCVIQIDDGVSCDSAIASFGGSIPADGRFRLRDLGDNRVSVAECIQHILDECAPYSSCDVFIEKSFIMPGTAVDAAESYMRHYGNIEASLICYGVPESSLHEIDPRDWQKHYPDLVPPRGKKGEAMDRAERRRIIKENSRKKAIELFTHLSPMLSRIRDDGRADACLILNVAICRIKGYLKVQPSKAEIERRENHGRKKKRHRSAANRGNNATTPTVITAGNDSGEYPPYE